MKTRRGLLLVVGANLLALPFRSLAQPKERVWRVGFLWPRAHLEPSVSDHYDEVARGLRNLGYVEGKNLVIETRSAEGHYERLPALAAELIQLKVDVIVTDGTAGIVAAQKATSTVPIVFGSAGDPVGNGLVRSLARPGGNTTGISLLAGDSLAGKQLEILLALVPRLSHLAVLFNPKNAYSLLALKNMEAAAKKKMVQVLRVEAWTPAGIDEGVAQLTAKKVDALIWLSDAVIFQQRCQIAALAARYRIPAMGQSATYTECGGLINYGSNQFDNYYRAARMVDKILKGANPGELPVEQPTKLELFLNRKAARALGLEFPPELLLLADKVIE